MGSRIELESEQGTGSTFYFTLYTRFEDGDKLDANSLDGIKRVLVVDDNDNNRMILEHTLKNWGIEFTGCDNGFSSLQMIEKSKMFDVAIVDYHMPYLNGLDTIRMIRETLKIGPEKLPIILLHSSSDDIAIHEECKRLKVRFNLIKPVKSQEPLHYIRNIRNVEDTEFKANELKETKQQALAENLKSTIMIVEDVELNMILARTIVKQLVPNAVILEAKNGRIGCELAEKHNISLILMDVQMPEMNGLEATERIRQMDKEKGIHTPILALSAGVVKGEKEKCFEAGMDDFLAKPISIDELRKAFERYLKREESTEEIITTEDDPKSHFDRDALLSRIDNNTTILNQILDTAKGDIQKDVDDLVSSIKEKDFDKIKSQGHALKGVALTLSFNKLGELAKEIEIAAKEGSDKIDSLVDDLTAEWNYIKTII
ncbi:Sensor histidine kinase RcsC [bioreactor metagenome]|uniref:Sensor histidine kinase RcsC n=1 Tax=bioreactor metagenome TaxID=1076179 RepID=A0A644ZSE7_9ZZZZ